MKKTKTRLSLWPCLLVAVLGVPTVSEASGLLPFEPDPEFQASRILPPDLLKSDNHKLQEHVSNDGFLNHYVVQTPYGDFSAEGNTRLERTIHEAQALAELNNVSQSAIFLDAAARTVSQPVEAVNKIIEEPGETVKGIPGGLSRKFHSLTNKAKSGVDSAKALGESGDSEDWEEEGKQQAKAYAAKWFGTSDAERRWAKKLGIDPYTSNQVLRKELKAVARVDAAASFGTKMVMPGMGALSYVVAVSNLVWSMDGEALRAYNLEKLEDAGISHALIRGFLNNPVFSPTQQTAVVQAILAIRHVDGVEQVLQLPVWVDTELEAWYYTDTVQLLASYNQSVRSIRSITADALVPGIINDRGEQVYVLPLDYLTWNEVLANMLDHIDTQASAQAGTREVWITGTTSQTARAGLLMMGWSVKTGITLQH